MNQLNPNLSFESLVDGYGWYAVTRLDGDPELAAVAADARSMNSDLEQAYLNFRSAARATMSAASTRDTHKHRLDTALRSVRTSVLGWVHNRRASKYYRALFPDGLAGVILTNPWEQIQVARNLLRKMTDYQIPALAPAIDVLQAAIDSLDAALTAYSASRQAREEARAAVQAAKVTYCRRYYGLYCQVAQIVGDPAIAMTYFRRERRRVPEPADGPGLSEGPPTEPDEPDPGELSLAMADLADESALAA